MRSLVLYYSQTGNTKTVAERLARSLGADIARFTCPDFEKGVIGGIRQGWSIFTRGTPAIELPEQAYDTYDLIVMAGPVWAARPAPPLRTVLTRRPALGARQALFLTCDGTSERFRASDALAEARMLCIQPPVAATLFRTADINSPKLDPMIEDFANLIRHGLKDRAGASGANGSARPSANANLAKA